MATNHLNPINTARQRVQNLKIQGVKDPKRILLAILDHLPQPGLGTIATEICGCTDQELTGLAEDYVSTVFKPLKASGGTTPNSVPSPAPGVEDEGVQLSVTHASPRTVYPRGIPEHICLPRDNYRCVITSLPSDKAPQNMRAPDTQVTPTRTCHIIPLAMAEYRVANQEPHAGSRTWNTLYRMFPPLQNIISSRLDDINDPRNLFTACGPVHDIFGRFEIAPRPVPDSDNTFIAVHWQQAATVIPLLPQNHQIQLNNNAPGTSLPDPYLFRVHLIVAEILHASGLAEMLDEALDDYYSLGDLASDGSTTIPYFIEVS